MAGPLDELLSMFQGMNDKTNQGLNAAADNKAEAARTVTPAPPGPLDKLKDLLNTPANEVAAKVQALAQPAIDKTAALPNTPLRDIPGKFPVPDYPNILGHLPSLGSAPEGATDVSGMAPPPAPNAPAPQAAPAPGVPHTPYPLGQSMGEGASVNFGGPPDITAMIKALANHVPNVEATPMPPASGMPGANSGPSGFEAFLKSLGNPGDEQPPPAGPEAKKNWAANTVTEDTPNANPNLPTPADTKPAPTKVSAGGDSSSSDETGQPKSLGGALSQGSKGNGSRAGSAVGSIFSADRKDEENHALGAGLMQFALTALLKPSWGGGSGIWNAINDASDTYNNYGAQRKAERDEVDQRAKNQADLTKSAAETNHLNASADNQRANAGKAKKEGDVLAETKKGDNATQVTEGMTPGAKLLFEKLTKNLTPEDIVAGKNGKGQYSEALRQAKELDTEEKAQGVTAAQKDSEKQAFTSASAGTLDMKTLQKLWPKEIALARTDKTGGRAAHLRAYMKNNKTELAKLEAALK